MYTKTVLRVILTIFQDRIANFLTPIEITVTQKLIEKPIRSNPILIAQTMQNSDRFCKMCPIVHPTLSQAEEKLGVPFALDCGDDNVCTSDLKVSGSFVGLG